MLDEDTGEPIDCPYCGSEDECPHLLAVLDRTSLECSGGYAFDRFDEFRDAIAGVFLGRLQADAPLVTTWKDPFVLDLWNHARENYSTHDDADDIEIDSDSLFGLIEDLFNDAGGEEYPGSIDDDRAPGDSSAITLFHARHPAKVFVKALTLLNGRLS